MNGAGIPKNDNEAMAALQNLIMEQNLTDTQKVAMGLALGTYYGKARAYDDPTASYKEALRQMLSVLDRVSEKRRAANAGEEVQDA